MENRDDIGDMVEGRTIYAVPLPFPDDLDPDEDVRHHYFWNRSTRPKRCRWFRPTADKTCSKCGRRLVFIPSHMTQAGIVAEHFRHARPVYGRRPRDRRRRAPVSDPHHSHYRNLPDGTSVVGCENALCRPVGHNVAFRHRAGSAGRLVLPMADEWAAFKEVAR